MEVISMRGKTCGLDRTVRLDILADDYDYTALSNCVRGEQMTGFIAVGEAEFGVVFPIDLPPCSSSMTRVLMPASLL